MPPSLILRKALPFPRALRHWVLVNHTHSLRASCAPHNHPQQTVPARLFIPVETDYPQTDLGRLCVGYAPCRQSHVHLAPVG